MVGKSVCKASTFSPREGSLAGEPRKKELEGRPLRMPQTGILRIAGAWAREAHT